MRTLCLLFIAALLLPAAALAQPPKEVTSAKDIFQEGFIQVIGYSEEGQSRYRAFTAAKVVAQRQMLEAFRGLSIAGETTVADGMLQSDQVKTQVEGFLRGAVPCGTEFNDEKGFAMVCLRKYVRGGGDNAQAALLDVFGKNGLLPKITAKASLEVSADGEPPEEIPAEAPAHDGLVVDVSDFDFEPALANRILNKEKEVVFDPTMVVQDVLIDRGSAGYASSESKAKALLSFWGCKNPLKVKCAGLGEKTDALLSSKDVKKVLKSDKVANLLGLGRVVFVLK